MPNPHHLSLATPVIAFLVGVSACTAPDVPPPTHAVDSTDTITPFDGVDSDTAIEPPATWRSVLYPEDWTPSYTLGDGRFLHDHSYAGYHAGEQPLPNERPTPIVDVRDHGADPTGATDSADAFEAALALLTTGGTLYLPAGTYVTSRRLDIRAPGLVVAGDGSDRTFVHATQDSGTRAGAWLRFLGERPSAESRWSLSADGLARAHEVTIDDPTGLAPGDLVSVRWTITPDFVAEHDMTDHWTLFVDEAKPFFLRTVVAIDGDQVTLDVPLRYPALTRDSAALAPDDGYLTEVGVEGLSVSTVVSTSAALAVDRHHAIELDRVMDGWVRDVATWDPTGDGPHLQSGGVYVQRSRRVTIADTHLGPAQNRGGGGNGYLFELSRAGEVLVRDSSGTGGRHNFIANWDFGTSGCVFLRTTSREGTADNGPFQLVGTSEFHHSLAMANLIDQSITDDGWSSTSRRNMSSGAGHAGTQNTFWNLGGTGTLTSWQVGWGYVVGTGPELDVVTGLDVPDLLLGHESTQPADHAEGLGEAAQLVPASLYEDQLACRLRR